MTDAVQFYIGCIMSFDISDLGLDAAVAATIMQRHEASEKGLKDNRDKVLSQNTKLKAVLGAADDEDLAKKLDDDLKAKEAEINSLKTELLTAKGDKDALEKHRQQIELDAQAKQQEITQRYENQIKQSAQSAFLEKILSKVADDKRQFANAYLLTMTDTSINEEGKATTVLKVGDKVYSSTDDFLKFAKDDESWAGMIKAPNTQGAGVNGSNQSGVAADTDKKLSEVSSTFLQVMRG